MNMPVSVFLALKYMRPKRTFISIVTVLSILGVVLGVALLVIVLSVMNGFDDVWREKILGFNAHITLRTPSPIEESGIRYERIESTPGVRGVAPYIEGLVFLTHGGEVRSPYLRGIRPEREDRVSRVRDHMVEGEFSVGDGEILLGAGLARRLGVGVGDTVSAFSPQSFASRDVLRLPEDLRVTGLFDLGMHDFDIGYVLCSIETAQDLFGMVSGVHGLQVMTEDPYRAALVARDLRSRLPRFYDVTTWMEQNRQLFTALRVEKNMMFFLLIFITIVAAFGITNTLITVTVQKTREVGLLKALGFSSSQIMGVFIWQGWIAGILGTLGGTGLGLLALRYRNALMHVLSRRLGLDLLPPELYQLSQIPSAISRTDLLAIAGTVMLICTLAGLIPAYRASQLDPARALRYE
jgi:lipoprotein-releasing system permease protein